MATFIVLVDLTKQGMSKIKDTARRADAFVQTAKAAGAEVKDLYWTIGKHDGVLIFDAPDDETAAALLLKLGSHGDVRTDTLRAFGRAEIKSILTKMNKKSAKSAPKKKQK